MPSTASSRTAAHLYGAYRRRIQVMPGSRETAALIDDGVDGGGVSPMIFGGEGVSGDTAE
jgi:hypothetical protein